MEAGLPDEDTEFGREATILHRYAVDPQLDRSFLSPNQRDLLERGDSLLEEVLARLGFGPEDAVYIERPLVSKDKRFPGRPDKIFVWKKSRALLIADWKFGFNEVDRAELNLQLRSYAVLGVDNCSEGEVDVYASIIQPRARYAERISLARYEAEDIKKARDQINKILDAAADPKAPLIPGEEQCRYCRAKLICPAFRTAITQGIIPFDPKRELSKAAFESWVEERLANVDDDALEDVYKAVRFAAMIKNMALNEVRKRIGRPDGFKDYIVGKTPEPRKIVSVRRAVALLSLSKVASREELLDVCSMPINEVEDIYRRRTGATWKDTREKINKILDSVIEIEERFPKILKK